MQVRITGTSLRPKSAFLHNHIDDYNFFAINRTQQSLEVIQSTLLWKEKLFFFRLHAWKRIINNWSRWSEFYAVKIKQQFNL